MAARSSPNSGAFRREPGDWPCSQCNEINFKSRQACRRCAAPRSGTTQSSGQTTAAAATGTTQVTAKPGDWTCSSCSTLNFASRSQCFKCKRAKAEPMEVDRPPPILNKPGDWKCGSCPEMNFGSRTVCRSCGAARPTAEVQSEAKKECVICMENLIDSVITSCGHSAVCLPCGQQLNQCPMCRVPFNQTNLIKLYNVH